MTVGSIRRFVAMLVWGVSIVPGSACTAVAPATDSIDDFVVEDFPGTICDGAGSGPNPTTQQGCACRVTSECRQGLHCFAAPLNGTRGEPFCHSACVENDDPSVWCMDDASCCDEDAVCTPRGTCVRLDDLVVRPSESEDGVTGGSSGAVDDTGTSSGSDRDATRGSSGADDGTLGSATE